MKQKVKGLLSIWLAVAMVICCIVPISADSGIYIWFFSDTEKDISSDPISSSSCLCYAYGPNHTLPSLWTHPIPDGKYLDGFYIYDCTYDANEETITIAEQGTLIPMDSYLTGTNFANQYGNDAFVKPIYKDLPTYSITFDYDADGDDTLNKNDNQEYSDDTATVIKGGSLELHSPTREGYIFDGWIIEDQNGWSYAISPLEDIQEDIVLTAGWREVFEITFDYNDETTPIVTKYQGATELIEFPDTPTREGYEFLFWGVYVNSAYVQPTGPNIVHQNENFVAQWDMKTYTIEYDVIFDGVAVPANTTFAYNEDPDIASAPTSVPVGYSSFGGWALTENSSTAATDEQIKAACISSQTDKITLYAIWVPDGHTAYTIEYVKVNESGNTVETETKYGETGEAIAIDTTDVSIANKYPHYVLANGYSGEVLAGSINRDGSSVLRVFYTPVEYTVNFAPNCDNYTGEMSPMSFTVNNTGKITKNAYSVDGYNFAGWALSETGDAVINDEAAISEVLNNVTSANGQITLYASWTQKAMYTVVFVADGEECGSVKIEDGSHISSGAIDAPGKDGYIFKGWSVDGTDVVDITTITIDKNTTFTAIFEKIAKEEKASNLFIFLMLLYKMTYEENGGSIVRGNIVNIDHTVDEPTPPTRDGYTFVGWCIDPELTTLYDFSTVRETRKGFTLYAKWEMAEDNTQE